MALHCGKTGGTHASAQRDRDGSADPPDLTVGVPLQVVAVLQTVVRGRNSQTLQLRQAEHIQGQLTLVM